MDAPDTPMSPKHAARMAMRRFRETGGATVNLYHGDLHGRHMFAVAVEGRGRRLPGKQVTSRRIVRYIEAQKDLLSREEYSLGMWYDRVGR
jgi:hypothetical protein